MEQRKSITIYKGQICNGSLKNIRTIIQLMHIIHIINVVLIYATITIQLRELGSEMLITVNFDCFSLFRSSNCSHQSSGNCA